MLQVDSSRLSNCLAVTSEPGADAGRRAQPVGAFSPWKQSQQFKGTTLTGHTPKHIAWCELSASNATDSRPLMAPS
jgi:hypothetical protein